MHSPTQCEGATDKHVLYRATGFSGYTHDEIAAFHEAVDYLVKLHRSGYLEDDAFADLIQYATATFIESEIDRKISYIFEMKFPTDRLMRFLR